MTEYPAFPVANFSPEFIEDVKFYSTASPERQFAFLSRCRPEERTFAEDYFTLHPSRRPYLSPTPTGPYPTTQD
jgi:hypothetical protein